MKKNQSIDQNQGKKTEIGQRINLIRTDFFDGDTAKLAEVLGIHYSNVSKIIKGEYSPNYESLRRLLESCPDLSALWLISGSGTMRNSQNINGSNNIANGHNISNISTCDPQLSQSIARLTATNEKLADTNKQLVDMLANK